MKKKLVCLGLFVLMLVMGGCDMLLYVPEYEDPYADYQDYVVQEETAAPEPSAVPSAAPEITSAPQPSGKLAAHFIDAGQADAILLQQDDLFMLVDAGDNDTGKDVVRYMNALGVEKLQVAVGTHPHADHIGGMDDVLSAFYAETLLMPEIITATSTFENVLDAAEKSGAELYCPNVGYTFSFGEAVVTVLAPDRSLLREDDLNNTSIVLHVAFGETAFLLTGDAEVESEKLMMKTGLPLRADVLKVGHHGSSSSSSEAFLDAVSPSIAIIQCKKGNDYGHPHREIRQTLKDRNIQTLRTDELGDIVVVSDGTVVQIGEAPDTSLVQIAYIGNANSRVFHLPDCQGLPSKRNRVEWVKREQAENLGYTPCGRCNP